MALRFVNISPFTNAFQEGDLYLRQGMTMKHVRDGAVLETRPLTIGATLTTQFHFGTNDITTFIEEFHMPGQNVSCTKVVENQTTGAVTFSFSSGNSIELTNWEAVGGVADELDAAPDFAEKILMLKAFRASPDGANKTTQVGAMVSVNGLADTPIVYTEPE